VGGRSTLGIVAGIVSVLVSTGACASRPAEQSAASSDTSTLIAAGVARIHWGGNQAADLNIRQMTGLDAGVPTQTSCDRRLGSRRVLYFDLNWRSVVNERPVGRVTLTVLRPDGDVLTVAEPDGRCLPMRNYRIDPLPPLDGEQFVLQLLDVVGRSYRGGMRLTVVFNGRRESLRLVPACPPDRGQTAARTCTIDPVSFDEGSGYSVHWYV
jgi:hypothetical protein